MVCSSVSTLSALLPFFVQTVMCAQYSRGEYDMPRTWSRSDGTFPSQLVFFSDRDSHHHPRKGGSKYTHTGRNSSLQLAAAAHEADLLPDLDGAAVLAPDLDGPGPAVQVLRVLPQWAHAGAEDVHAVHEAQRLPGEVVVDTVEGADVGHVLGQQRQAVGEGCAVGIVTGAGAGAGGGGGGGGGYGGYGAGTVGFVVPDGPDVLEGEGPEFGDDVLVEGG